jgi:succinate dehydrogenase / fumarate reductase flavoprotein subunit
VTGGREYNPGWHLALDLPKQLLVSECIALSALTREESRGGHTRNDFPEMDPEWRKVNLVCHLSDTGMFVSRQDLPSMPAELVGLFSEKELSKYVTAEELSSIARGTA